MVIGITMFMLKMILKKKVTWQGTIQNHSTVAHQKFDDDVEHPAPFPEKIIILPLLQTTNEGDLVLDPFCGSYTTGRVSQRNNRRFVGYDVKVY